MIKLIIICFMVSSLSVTGILLVRRLFRNQLSAKGQYHLWFLLLIALIFPFIPVQFLPFEGFNIAWEANQRSGSDTSFRITEEILNQNWMQDYSISVNRSNLEYLNILTAFIWIIGILVMSVLAVKAWLDVKRVKRTMYRLDKELEFLFEQCKKELNISGNIFVGNSQFVKSPMIFGFFKQYVVLPVNFAKSISMDEIKYIFLHELNHYKFKDTAVNNLFVIFQIIYWFNPLIWIAYRKMRLDREIACDHAVLSYLDEKCHGEYGMTIINFIDHVSRQKNYIFTNEFNGSKKQIKSRIERIASYRKESKILKLKSTVIFTFLGVLVAGQIPLISAIGNDHNHYDFNGEKALYVDLNEHFTDYNGSFVLYDSQLEQYQIYNKDRGTLRVSPNSTYKIYSALLGLESNLISSENTTLKWNGIEYPFDSWNSQQSLETAMKRSVNWYFQELDGRNQAGIINSYLKRIKYGNADISGGIDQFWLESSLKISPIEQVQLLMDLYTNQFGFKEKNIQTVKEAIKLEEKDDVILSGKTGTGSVNGSEINGWFIGYVEWKENTFFFATNIQGEEKASGKKAAEITLSILKEKGIY